MGHHIAHCCENLCAFLDKKARSQEPFDVKTVFGAYVLDVTVGTSLGFEVNSLEEIQDNKASVFLEYLKTFFRDFTLLPKGAFIAFCFPFLIPVFQAFGYGIEPYKANRFISKTIKQLLDERRKTTYQGKPDLLQMMLEVEDTEEEIAKNPEEKKLTADEILAQSFMIVVAAFESTSSIMQFLIHLLVIHPDIQDKLYQHIADKLGNAELNLENLNSLSYLDSVLREAKRLYPPGAVAAREAIQERVINGVTIPAGSCVGLSFYGIARDPELFPEPLKFNPERYEDESLPSLVRDIAFGCGPRQCIGLRLALYEEKMAVVACLRKFKFVKVPQTPDEIVLATGGNNITSTNVPIIVGVRLRSAD